MKRTLLLIAFSLVHTLAQAENWISDELRIRATLPDPPAWDEFKSSDPNSVVGRRRPDRSAMITISAKAFPDIPLTEINEELAKVFMTGAAGPGQEVPPLELTSLDGVKTYRASMRPTDRIPAHRTVLVFFNNKHVVAFLLISTKKPVAENAELQTFVRSIRAFK